MGTHRAGGQRLHPNLGSWCLVPHYAFEYAPLKTPAGELTTSRTGSMALRARTNSTSCPLPPTEGCATTITTRLGVRQTSLSRTSRKRYGTGIPFRQKSYSCVDMFAKAMSLFKPRQIAVSPSSNLPTWSPKRPLVLAIALAATMSSTPAITYYTFQDIDPDTLDPLNFAGQSRLHALRG
jgi:hypothetical protein